MKKRIKKKLVFNKSTISNLAVERMNQVRGGETEAVDTCPIPCESETCPYPCSNLPGGCDTKPIKECYSLGGC